MNKERIMQELSNTGAEIRESTTAAGLYYDGTQHGETFPIIRCFIEASQDRQQIETAVEKVLKKHKKRIGVKKHWSMAWTAYDIMTKTDAIKADELQAEADTFLSAFWEELHRQKVNGEEKSDDKAVKAGREAIQRMTTKTA